MDEEQFLKKLINHHERNIADYKAQLEFLHKSKLTDVDEYRDIIRRAKNEHEMQLKIARQDMSNLRQGLYASAYYHKSW